MLSRRQTMRKRTTGRLCSIAVLLAVGLVTLTIVLSPKSADARRRLPGSRSSEAIYSDPVEIDSSSDEGFTSQDLDLLENDNDGKALLNEWRALRARTDSSFIDPTELKKQHTMKLELLIKNIKQTIQELEKEYETLKGKLGREVSKKQFRGAFIKQTNRDQKITELKTKQTEVYNSKLNFQSAHTYLAEIEQTQLRECAPTFKAIESTMQYLQQAFSQSTLAYCKGDRENKLKTIIQGMHRETLGKMKKFLSAQEDQENKESELDVSLAQLKTKRRAARHREMNTGHVLDLETVNKRTIQSVKSKGIPNDPDSSDPEDPIQMDGPPPKPKLF